MFEILRCWHRHSAQRVQRPSLVASRYDIALVVSFVATDYSPGVVFGPTAMHAEQAPSIVLLCSSCSHA